MVDFLYNRNDIVQNLYHSIGEYGNFPPYVPTDPYGHKFLFIPFDQGTTLTYVFGIAIILFVVWCTIGGLLLSLGFRNVRSPYSGTIKISRSGGKGSISIGLLLLIGILILPAIQKYLPIPSPDSPTAAIFWPSGDVQMVPFPPFTKNFLLGSDTVGYDMLSMTIRGTWPTLLLVLECTLATIVPAFILSIIGGVWKSPFIRGLNVAWASLFKVIPSLLACLFILDIPDVYWYDVTRVPGAIEWGTAFQFMFIAVLAFTEIGRVSEVLQNTIDTVQEKSFVEASETLGASQWAKFRQHMKRPFFDALYEQIVVSASRLLLLLASLSFFGHTIQQVWVAPQYKKDPWAHYYVGNDWITLIANDAHYWLGYPWMLLAPILFITLTVISLNLIQTGLREYFQSARVRSLRTRENDVLSLLRPTFVIKWGNKRTRARGILTYLTALILCFCVIKISLAGQYKSLAAISTGVPTTPNASTGGAPKTIRKTSTTVKVGEWKYTINSLEEGKSVAGDKAKGVYLIVNITAEDVDQASMVSTLSPNSFTLLSGGKQYNTDSTTTIDVNLARYKYIDIFSKGIRPGLSLTGNVVFDLPLQAMNQHCELRLSGGTNSKVDDVVRIK